MINFNVQEKIGLSEQCFFVFLNEFSCRFFAEHAWFGRFLAYKINGRFSCAKSLPGF